jgi:hypothetical protein
VSRAGARACGRAVCGVRACGRAVCVRAVCVSGRGRGEEARRSAQVVQDRHRVRAQSSHRKVRRAPQRGAVLVTGGEILAV